MNPEWCTMKNSIIFLDIDGVLATDKQYRTKKTSKSYVTKYDVYPFDKKCVEVFNEILSETNADIVLSSDWQLYWSLEELNEIFKINGVDKSPFDITNQIKVKFTSSTSFDRASAINKYTKTHNITDYVVIDDLDMTQFFGDEFVYCARGDMEGIKQSGIKNKILKVLSNDR